METTIKAEVLQNEIIEDMKTKFGIHVHSVSPIDWRHGNVCTLMNTDRGVLFVKVHGKVRNKRTMDGTRQALKYQDQMHHAGIPCQPVFHYNGEYVYTTVSGEDYTISGASEGKHIEAGQANEAQMFTLGRATGLMHQWMKTHLPTCDSLHWKLPSKESRANRLDKNLQETLSDGHERYAAAIERQKTILQRLDLNELKASQEGWAHWDMHVDNLMFFDDRVADIIDFDRVSYVYSDFDISRALLSCAWSPEGIPSDKVKAYIDGYSCYANITSGQITRSIKLTWYKECKWIHSMYRNNRPMSRFIEELIWIGTNWDELEEIIETA